MIEYKNLVPSVSRDPNISETGKIILYRLLTQWVMQLLGAMAILATAVSSYAQLPFTEDFSTTDYRDAGPNQTTADWNVNFQQLLLPVSPQLTGVTFDETSVVEVIDSSYVTRALDLADLDGVDLAAFSSTTVVAFSEAAHIRAQHIKIRVRSLPAMLTVMAT
jgi:hypothetical protein